MQWTLLEAVGDYPPASRAHSATLIDRKIVVIGGGLGSAYYSSVHIFDTATRRWHLPNIAPGPNPAPRRAHSAVFYKGKIWVFGGGNGLTALNDLWTLDITPGLGIGSSKPMRWEEIRTAGPKPNSRGYHTSTLVGNIMVVIGGSDSKECYTDVWTLNLGRVNRCCLLFQLTPLVSKILFNGSPVSNQAGKPINVSRIRLHKWDPMFSLLGAIRAPNTFLTYFSTTSVSHVHIFSIRY